ncbi:MAG: YkgJ family cysteine cluster protein [Thermoplasmata archaeon]
MRKSSEVKIQCISNGCFLCCMDTEMMLLEEDIVKLENAGYKQNEFSYIEDGFVLLKNVDGHCVFLKAGLCSVYPIRPAGCKLYPFVFDADNEIVKLDPLCRYVNSPPSPDTAKAVIEVAHQLLYERDKRMRILK